MDPLEAPLMGMQKDVVIISKGNISHENVSHVLRCSTNVDHRLGMIVVKNVNFQLLKVHKKHRWKKVSHILWCYTVTALLTEFHFNLCIIVYRYELYLRVIYSEPRDFKGIQEKLFLLELN